VLLLSKGPTRSVGKLCYFTSGNTLGSCNYSMASNFRTIGAHCRRIAAFLCIAGVAATLCGRACGMTRIEIFQATVPLASSSEAAQSAAFEAALKVVLVRATGRLGADDEAEFAPLLSNARRYVQQYRSAPDGQLWVAFDGAVIERWLTQNGQPLWSSDRPTTFVWVAVQGPAPTAAALSADDTSELKLAIDAAAAERGIPLVWPSAETVAAGAPAVNPIDAAHRLGAEGVLTGRAAGTAVDAAVHWTFAFQDHSREFAGGVQDGVNHAADLYAGMYAASGSLAPVEIQVSGIVDLHDYAAVQAFLESLSFVTHAGVESLTGDSVQYRLTMRGGIDSLLHAIALNGRLQSIAGGENGIQRFELRR
jgi:hypothetical protein